MKSGKITSGGSQRTAALDMLRGIALIEMIVYHGLYDWVFVFGRTMPFMHSKQAYWWQQSICWLFILLSGAVLNYGRRPIRRGIQVFLCGMLLTVVTLAVIPSEQIWFGVLHFLGCAAMLCGFLRPWLSKIPSSAGAVGSFVLFSVFKQVPSGLIGILDIPLVSLPASWYSQSWLFPLGLPGYGFISADYFPLIPWLFLYLTGFYLWRIVMNGSLCEKIFAIPQCRPLAWLGRHSLWIYLLHQPALMAVTAALNYCL